MRKGLFGVLLAAALAGCLSSPAADHYVAVDGSGFSPATLQIQVGDSVTWENIDDMDYPHSSTSSLSLLNPDYWVGYLVGFGDTFSHTFNRVGTFDYIDQFDVGTGTIQVSSGGGGQAIQLSSPRLEGNRFLFDATGLTAGKTNVLLSSADLSSWISVSTNVATGTSATLTNSAGSGSRCYRLEQLP